MTQRDFLYKLRRGLGSAIVELQMNPDREKYRDIVLRCCLKNISYDVQCEGTKGYYLYTAICTLGAKDEFEDVMICAFMKRLEYNFFQQVTDILYLYAGEGGEKARNALYTKRQQLAKQLAKQKVFPHKFCEREQYEYLMICEINAFGWAAFKKCIVDAGRILMNRNDDACSGYDWFMSHCEDIFGKERIAHFLKIASERSDEVKAFVAATNELEKVREENMRLRIEPIVTLESYITRAQELGQDKYAYMRMTIAAKRFSRQASPNDMLGLISRIADEQSDEVRANLLRVFKDVDFPADIDVLIPYAQSKCEQLQKSTIDALGRLKVRRVHDLAIQLIQAGSFEAGLHLLIVNWHRQDEALIRERILSSKKVSHSMQQSIRDIYLKHRSKSCGDILEHVYQNAECAFCRSCIVETMWKNRVLRTAILNECMYDSYYETRKIAEKIKKNKE